MSGLLFRRVAPYDSIMFPLFGTRNPDRVPEAVAFELLETVLAYLTAKPFSWLDRIYFLAYTDSDLRLITGAIEKAKLKLLSEQISVPTLQERKAARRRILIKERQKRQDASA